MDRNDMRIFTDYGAVMEEIKESRKQHTKNFLDDLNRVCERDHMEGLAELATQDLLEKREAAYQEAMQEAREKAEADVKAADIAVHGYTEKNNPEMKAAWDKALADLRVWC